MTPNPLSVYINQYKSADYWENTVNPFPQITYNREQSQPKSHETRSLIQIFISRGALTTAMHISHNISNREAIEALTTVGPVYLAALGVDNFALEVLVANRIASAHRLLVSPPTPQTCTLSQLSLK